MTEKELIGKLQELRQIKPRKDWVILTKTQILGEEPKRSLAPFWGVLPRWIFQSKPTFATLIVLMVIVGGLTGGLTISQNSLPGDFLYPIKKMVERSQAVFVSEQDKSQASLELANKRLEELTKIAETNQVKKLVPALEEYQASLLQATENLKKFKDSSKLRKEEIVQQTQKLEEKKQILENVYGVAGLEGEEGSNPTKIVVEWLIVDLEGRSLTEDQQEYLKKAKEYFEAENFALALEKILLFKY